MAYGRPVVATRVGGLVDGVEDGVSGVLVDAEGSAPELQAAIGALLADPEQRRALGLRARELAGSRYGWPAATESLHAAYAAISSGSRLR
jgi:glycosyltransferase involved in cell wall biosynthesis